MQTHPAETTVTGSPSQVLDALEKLKARHLLDAGQAEESDLPTALTQSESAGHEITQGPPQPSKLAREQVDVSLAAGQDLLGRSRAILQGPNPDVKEAEALAREALPKFRSALDWAEDSDLEDAAHEALDGAGRYVRKTFSCVLEYSDGSYYQTCPVALGHDRVGLSIGGVATRQCSLCDLDISECEHDPMTEYMIAGTTTPDGYCRICVEQDCSKHKSHLLYKANPVSIITEMMVDEISFVARPAQPDARILREELSTNHLQKLLGDQFVPGAPAPCDRCLSDCGGLIQFVGPQGRTEAS
jgi:hypothetical protein